MTEKKRPCSRLVAWPLFGSALHDRFDVVQIGAADAVHAAFAQIDAPRAVTMVLQPDDAFAALGHWGQALYVLPEAQLVIVRYGDDRDGSYRHNELLKRVLAAVQP